MALDPVQIIFSVGGVAEVEKAFQTVDQVMTRFERVRTQSGQRAVRAARQEAGQMADAHIKATEKWTKEQDKLRKQSERESARVSKKEADDAIRNAQRASSAVEKLQERRFAQLSRDVAREERLRIQSAERIAREERRILDRKIREESAARAKMDRAYGRVGGMVSGTVSRMTGAAVALGAAGLTLGGGLTVADTVSRSMSAEKAAINLATSAYISSGDSAATRTRPRKEDILSRASAVHIATGVDKAELIKGWQDYVDLASDYKGGLGNLQNFAMISKATGTDFRQLMNTAGTMRVQNKGLGEKDMMNILLGIIGQGGRGAMTMKDLAEYAGEITATSGQYGGNQSVNQQRLLGLSQLGRRVASPAESATAVNKLAVDVATNADYMQSQGINVKDKNGLLDPAVIIANLMKKTGGDVGKLKELGIGERSMRLFNAANETFKEAGRGEAGAAAVEKEIRELENATYSTEEVMKDFAEVMKGSSEKFEQALNKAREVLEQRLTPYIDRFADKFPELLPKIENIISAGDSLAKWFLDNPIKGIGAIILANVAKDLAGAGIGVAIKNVLVGMMSGANAGYATGGALGAAKGVATGAGAAIGTAGAIAGAGIVAIGAEYNSISTTLDAQQKGQRIAGELLADAQDPKKAAEVRKRIMQAHERSGGIKGNLKDVVAGTYMAGGMLYSAVTGNENPAARQLEDTRIDKEILRFESKIVDALNRAAENSRANGPLGMANPAHPARYDDMNGPGRGGSK